MNLLGVLFVAALVLSLVVKRLRVLGELALFGIYVSECRYLWNVAPEVSSIFFAVATFQALHIGTGAYRKTQRRSG